MTIPTPSVRLGRQLLAAASAIALASGTAFAAALPTGGKVEAGAAALSQTANSLTVHQSTSRLQMGWDSFDIGAGHSVTFQQPSSSALAVNLVRGGDASVIAGSLNANGRVVLVNPQGIAFTGTSQVNVGSLVASALRDVSGDFADGRTVLSGPGGEVANAGVITVSTGGSAVLAGSRVTNTGHILADAGRVALAAGSQVSLDYAGDGLIQLAVDAGAVDAAVANGGAIRVGSGHLLLTAKAADALASSVVRNTGELQASAVVERGGEIWLTADAVESSGTVAATSTAGQGGQAHLVGRKSVSVTGTVDVTGGAKGGFVDVSAPAVNLPSLFQVKVGRGGHFLLDPDNITIDAVGSPILSDPTNSSPLSDIVLSKFAIQTWLGGGADLTIEAVANLTVQSSIFVGGAGSGDLALRAGGKIDILQPINLNGSLSLSADGDITVNAAITSAADLTLTAGGAGDVNVNDALSANTLTLSAIGTGSVTTLAGATLSSDTSLSVSAVSGDVTLGDTVTATGALLLQTGAGDISLSGAVTAASAGIATTTGDLRLGDDLTTTVGDVTLSLGGDVWFDQDGVTVTAAADLNITLAGDPLTPITEAAGGAQFEMYRNGTELAVAGWLIAEDLTGPSSFALAGDVRMQWGFGSGFSLPTAEDLTFVSDATGFKNADLKAGETLVGYRGADTFVDAFTAPNLGFTWDAAAPTATSPVGSTFAYTATLGAGFVINKPGYLLVAMQDAGVLTVRTRELLVKPDDLNGTYGTFTKRPKYLYQITGFQNGDTLASLGITGEGIVSCSYDEAVPANRGAGDYVIGIDASAITATLVGPNYEYNVRNGVLTIAKAPLRVTADDKSRVYADANPAFTHTVSTGDLRYSDTVGSVLTGAPALSTTANLLSAVGSYDIVADVGTLVNLSPNYDIVLVDGTLTVTKAPLTVTALPASREYGAPNSDITYTYGLSGFRNGDDALTAGVSGAPAFSTTALVTSPIGDYTINVSNGTLLAANYDFTTFLPGTLTVTKAPLTVTAQNATREYGLPNSGVAFTYLITGLRNGDSASVVTGSPVLSTLATQLDNVGAYPINVTAGTLAAANYQVGFLVAGTLTISPATSLVITANNQRRLYGDANPSLTGEYTITGFRNGDTVVSSGIGGLAAVTLNPAVTVTSNVGNYPISVAIGTLADAAPTNYDLAAARYVAGVLTIDKAPASLVADSKSRTYGDANPTFTYAIAGLRNGETRAGLTTSGALTGAPALATVATSQSNAGTYDITIGVGSLAATNYEFTTLTKGTLTVDKRPLTVTANPQTREYGSADQFTLGSEASYVIDGFLFSQTAAGLRLSGDLTGSPSMSTNAELTSDVGVGYSVNIAKGTLSATNYSFDTSTFNGAGYAITQAPVTVTASDKARIYGDPNPALEYTLSGFKLGETNFGQIGATGLPVLATVANELSNVGSYPVTVDVAAVSSKNYSFVGQPGTITITKASLDLTVNAATSEYGSDFAGFSLTMTGFKNGQTQAGLRSAGALPTGNLSGDATYTYTNAQVKLLDVAGSPYTVAVTSLGTLAATNYDFVIQTPPAGTGLLTITPAPLTLKATDITRTYGDAWTQLQVDDKWDIVGLKNGQTRDGLVASGAITAPPTVSSPKAVDALTNAGTHAGAVTVSAVGFALNPTGNYSIDPLAATVAADLIVNKSPVVVGLLDTPVSKVYGDALPTFSPSYTGLKNGEVAATAGLVGAPVFTTTATSSSNVGSYGVTVDVSGLSAPNYTFTKVDGSLTVTKAPLTVSADAKTREYGINNPTLTATITGFKLGQVLATSGVTGSASLATTATPTSAVAGSPYPITVALGTLASSNYAFTTFNDSTLTVTKAPLTISVAAKTKIYGDANPALTYSVLGLRQADTEAVILGGVPVLSTGVNLLTGAGTYVGAITADLTGLSAANYNLFTTAGTFTVQKATLTGRIGDVTRTFGTPNPDFTVTWTGFKNGDTAATSGFTGSLAFTTEANPASPVAGSPYPVSAATGTYVSPNYAFGAIADGLVNVEPGNIWLNVTGNLSAVEEGAGARAAVAGPLLRADTPGDPGIASFTFDRLAVRLLPATPEEKEKAKEEAKRAAPAPGSVSKN